MYVGSAKDREVSQHPLATESGSVSFGAIEFLLPQACLERITRRAFGFSFVLYAQAHVSDLPTIRRTNHSRHRGFGDPPALIYRRIYFRQPLKADHPGRTTA
jgi:hypothetical protein